MTIISHGTDNDQNIVVQAQYDRGGRMVSLRHPDGRQDALRYDQLNRRTTHVRGWVAQATDPAQWVWSAANSRWEDGGGSPIQHGTNDQNLVTRLAHRLSNLSTPGGAETLLTDALGQDTVRRFDPLGRLRQIDYGDPVSNYTPNIGFAYDLAGNRTAMNEYGDAAMSTLQRRTTFEYDQARRLNQVAFDTDGDSVVEQTVSYTYDRGGQRTTLTIDEGGTPLTISYQYDAKGRLIGLSDWDSQATNFEYDGTGRHTATRRANDLDTTYQYDRASRLKELRHEDSSTLFGIFRYTLDKRGNRVRVEEALRTEDGDPTVTYLGSWAGNTTSDPNAIVRIPFAFEPITLEIGTGPNYSMFDIYVNGAFWGTVDGYDTTAGSLQILITVNQPGPHKLEIRNRDLHSWRARTAANFNPADYTMRFMGLVGSDSYDAHDIQYTYDALSRLQTADYDNGATIYTYGYDVAGNLLNNNGVSRGYNAINQLVNDGTNTLSYDRKGNLVSDGSRTYVWDQANRLVVNRPIGHGTVYYYSYDGLGNRFHQGSDAPTMGPEPVVRYLLDMQPGLTQVIGESMWFTIDPKTIPGGTPDEIKRYIHAPRGIHAMQNNAGTWSYAVQDGLGSVRSEIDETLNLVATGSYQPYGRPIHMPSAFGLPYQFTGEIRDWNGWQYHRARYYSPDIGVFPSLDPFEGVMDRPMSLNGYSWVEGNTPNAVDPAGLQGVCASVGGIFGAVCTVAEAVGSAGSEIGAALSGVSSAIGSVALPGAALTVQLLAFPFIVTGSTQRIDTGRTGDLTNEERRFLADLCNANFCGATSVGTRGVGVIPDYGIPGISSQAIPQDQAGDEAVPIPLDRVIPRRPCPPCPRPNPKCHVDRVPPSHTHPPCLGDHYHERFVNQNPVTCQCNYPRQRYLTPANCISPQGAPPPNPPCDTWI